MLSRRALPGWPLAGLAVARECHSGLLNMRFSCAARTDTGLRRSTNEDSFCVREDLGLFVVADGMGGHVAGEVASQLAIEETERFVAGTTNAGVSDTGPAPFDPRLGQNGNRLKAGLLEANRQLTLRINDDARLQGMATTAVAILVDDTPGALAHVGDSRAYLYRGDEFTRLTRDHSWVEEQIRAGALSPEAARDHPRRNIVTRALAGGATLDVDVAELKLEAGDRVLLCSDGLTSVLSDAAIAEVLTGDLRLEGICDDLIRQANEQGGPDNVTVVVIDVDAG